MLNLTDMWKATGEVEAKKPKHYFELTQANELVEVLKVREKVGKTDLIKTTLGRNGFTLAHPIIGLAYAKYLSPEFHIWCNEILLASEFITVEDEKLTNPRATILKLPATPSPISHGLDSFTYSLSSKIPHSIEIVS